MGLKCGIVGLPNVGKSTIFRALTNATAEVANYPFCTIDPNQGTIIVPDSRLDELTDIFKPKVTTPTTVEIVDIAGLVRGASEGEGLGNQFLAQIREVDAICHIVRCFEDQDIVHVNGKVDPIFDIEIINTELILKDLDTLTKRFSKAEKLAKHEKKDAHLVDIYDHIKHKLEEGFPARKVGLTDDEIKLVADLNLLTLKPVLYVANVSEEQLPNGGEYASKVMDYANSEGAKAVVISGKIESELAELESETERKEYLLSFGLNMPGKYDLITAAYQLLGLITFFTGGEKEVRAWTVSTGAKAPQAAGVIHSDFERGFISAEIVSYEKLLECRNYHEAKNRGWVRLEGKEYVVQDGDICIFRFSV